MSARDEVLARIRGALGDGPPAPEVPRDYRTGGDHPAGSAALVELLVDRLEDYRALVVRVDGDAASIGAAVSKALSDQEIRETIAASGVPGEWVADAPGLRVDDGSLTPRELDVVGAVVTGSVVAVAETGTIVLDGSPLCGRRAITLVPDTHVCVVRHEDVVGSVPEGLARLDPARPLTFISGPSATSDIELSRVEGVHGPRTLVVVVAGGSEPLGSQKGGPRTRAGGQARREHEA
ncbi:lactate utilization protein B/C [Intrasporangium oryzae NRRL B-24470]|uniref:Lactate utilization protein B/C n=1 Tax=Intrasporangium oryzae NRRL B-24470 TaxID=1386089 RepID=W9G4I2_9MICO|nr:LUD domain-containing protein [Intrasporangium oryzae]EWS99707.1 lactate utilization protein B/C [Intrasporangium oryzae NRRL B-24470]